MTDMQATAWQICERVSEAQAMLNDHLEHRRHTEFELIPRACGALE